LRQNIKASSEFLKEAFNKIFVLGLKVQISFLQKKFISSFLPSSWPSFSLP